MNGASGLTKTTVRTRDTDSDPWPLVAALAFAVGLGVSFAWAPPPPNIDASGAAIVAWAEAQRGAVPIQVWLAMLAWLPGSALVALTHRRLRGASAAAFLFGAVFLASSMAVGALLRLAVVRHAADLSPTVARFWADMEAHWGPLATIANVIQASALAIATRRGAFPSWFLPITSALALQQLFETVTMFGEGSFLAPGGALNQLGALVFAAWAIALGVASSRPARERT